MEYKCWMCGICCHEVPGDYVKRIPLYPDEADVLIEIAKNRQVDFLIVEDLVFPDTKNERILVLTYRIRLDNETQGCPFYSKTEGCTVQDVKPLACQAYPLALKQIDAFNFEISIDPLCNFVIENYGKLEKIDKPTLQQIFKDSIQTAKEVCADVKAAYFQVQKEPRIRVFIIQDRAFIGIVNLNSVVPRAGKNEVYKIL
ncbi:MAG: YkgJ family cysteine cluster protein, partial [Promethearchaeota archaeon]